MLMTNGIGATVGTLSAQMIVNRFCSWQDVPTEAGIKSLLVGDWQTVWFIFAGYALIVGVLFAVLFKPKKMEVGG
jgi:hypothetical protein